MACLPVPQRLLAFLDRLGRRLIKLRYGLVQLPSLNNPVTVARGLGIFLGSGAMSE